MDTTTLQSLMLLTLIVGVGGLVVYQVRVGHTDHILATLMTGAGLTVLIDLPLSAHQPKQSAVQCVSTVQCTLKDHVDFQPEKLKEQKRSTFLKFKKRKPVKVIRLTNGVTFVMLNLQVDRDKVAPQKLEKVAQAKELVTRYKDPDVRREMVQRVKDSVTKYHRESKADLRERASITEMKTTANDTELPGQDETPQKSKEKLHLTESPLERSGLK